MPDNGIAQNVGEQLRELHPDGAVNENVAVGPDLNADYVVEHKLSPDLAIAVFDEPEMWEFGVEKVLMFKKHGYNPGLALPINIDRATQAGTIDYKVCSVCAQAGIDLFTTEPDLQHIIDP